MAGKTRAPHKEGCMCVVCKSKRGVGEVIAPLLVEPEIAIAPPPPPPTEVRLDSLLSAAKFELEGQKHRVGVKFEGMVVCYNLAINDSATLGGSTMVKPIK